MWSYFSSCVQPLRLEDKMELENVQTPMDIELPNELAQLQKNVRELIEAKNQLNERVDELESNHSDKSRSKHKRENPTQYLLDEFTIYRNTNFSYTATSRAPEKRHHLYEVVMSNYGRILIGRRLALVNELTTDNIKAKDYVEMTFMNKKMTPKQITAFHRQLTGEEINADSLTNLFNSVVKYN